MKKRFLAAVLAALMLTGCAGTDQPPTSEDDRVPSRLPVGTTAATQATTQPPPAPTEPANPDGDYYITSKYADVKVDAANHAVTLSKKLTVSEFTSSFSVQINHIIKVYDAAADQEITDKNAIITDGMVCRVFTAGEPILDISIATGYDPNTPTRPVDPSLPEVADVVNLSNLGDAVSGTMAVTADGIRFDTSARTPTATVLLPTPLSLTGKGNLVLTLQNTSDATALTVEFITEADGIFTSFKTFQFPLKKAVAFQEQTVDVSGCYGWLGRLTGLRIRAEGLTEGALTLKYLTVRPGGSQYISGLQFSDTYLYMDAQERIDKIDLIGPDGILGSWRDKNGDLRFISSATDVDVSGYFVSAGTPEDPFAAIVVNDRRVGGVDWEKFHYCSIAQVLREPSTGMLIGITHLERSTEGGIVATIGLSTSVDDGESWEFLGEFISHDIPLEAKPEISRDIGNGTIMTDNEYLYIFINDYQENTLSSGIAICRVKLTELYEKVLAGQLPEAWKYCDGQWNEPGWGGRFTNVLPTGITPNFLYITHNTVLNKYLMVICQAPHYQNNDGDILMLASDSLVDWSDAQQQWIATGIHGEQYPTIISAGDDPQLETGETFYIYWCDWDSKIEGLEPWYSLWSSARYLCCKVTVTP